MFQVLPELIDTHRDFDVDPWGCWVARHDVRVVGINTCEMLSCNAMKDGTKGYER